MIRTTDFSRLAACSPVNATAARVTSGSRVEGPQRGPPADRWRASAPPPVLPPRYHPLAHSGFIDLTGRRFGRFEVIGYLGKANPKKKARWLVRCSCGDFEVRGAAAIKAACEADACCWNCNRVEAMWRGREVSRG